MLSSEEHNYRDYVAASVNAATLPNEGTWPLVPGQIFSDDVISVLPWGVAILDCDGVIVSVNRDWLRLSTADGSPLPPEKRIGVHYSDVVRRDAGLSEEGARKVHQGIREVLARRQAFFTLEFSHHVLVGQRWSQLAVSSLANGGAGALIQQFDITERKLAEKERDEALRECKEATDRECASREALRQMELFMALAGHEVRTPLTVIKGHMQLVRRQLESTLSQGEVATAWPSAMGSLDIAQQAANRLTKLLDDLLEVTNAKAGRLAMHPEWCDLVALVREQVAEQRPLHPSRRVRLHLECHPCVVILADPVRLAEVLTNFLNNACKFSPEQLPIDVKLHVDTNAVRISVLDQGPGLSPSAQAHIWECFYQVPGVKSHTGEAGLGLGLYISRAIVEQHGGIVGVDSTVGKGATFWCTLPLTAHEI